MLEDKSGRIWAFTELGAQRHNGNRFELVPEIPARHSVIYASANHPDGRIFMFSSSGKASVYDSGSWQLHPLSGQIERLTFHKNDLPYALTFGKRGSLFIQSAFSLFQESPGGKLIKELKTNKLEPKLLINVVENEGQLMVYSPLVGGSGNPTVRPDKTYEIRFQTPGLSKPVTTQLKPETRQHRRFFPIRTGAGIAVSVFDFVVLKNEKNEIKATRLPSGIMDLKLGPDKRLWVATRHNGIYFLDKNLEITDSTLRGKAIGNILFDTQGGVWASSLNEGVFYLPTLSTRLYNKIRPSPDHNIQLNSLETKLLVGVNKFLFLHTEKKDSQVSLPVTGDFAQTDLLPVPNGYLLSSKQGILELDTSFNLSGRLLSSKSLDDVYANGLIHHGSEIYLTSRTTLYKVDQKFARPIILPLAYICHGIKSFAGYLWIAGSNGLSVYSIDNQKITLVKEILPGLEIVKIKVEKSGIWVVVPGKGIFNVRADFSFKRVIGLENFSGLQDFVLTADSLLFAAGGSGLLRGRLNSDYQFFPEKLIYPQTVNQVVKYNHEIWFAGRSGVLFFPLEKPVSPPFSPMLLAEVAVNGVSKKPGFPAVFQAEENSLTFRFDLLSFSTPQTGLSFNLSGQETQQGHTVGTELAFQNLSPGKYRLQVSGRGIFGERLSQPRILTFEIKPAFWQTWWFQALAFAGLVVLISVIIWLIFNYYRKSEEERSRVNQLLASYKLRALQSQMNPHFVSNALSAIQQLILTKDHLRANQYLTKFSRLLRLVLSFSEKPFIPLSGEINLINLNVDLERLRFANRFSFLLEVDKSLNVNEILIPSMITQPFVENAIWHGLIPLKDEREAVLKMRIYPEGEVLKIMIEDNGIGRNASSAKTRIEHNSIGLRLTNERLQNINSLIKSTLASVSVFDLVEDNQPLGTRIFLSLPPNIHQFQNESLPD